MSLEHCYCKLVVQDKEYGHNDDGNIFGRMKEDRGTSNRTLAPKRAPLMGP